MWRVKYYFGKIKYRLTNLRGGWDYLLVLFTAFNLYGLVNALSVGNISGVIINGLFLALCVRSLLN